MAPVMVVQIHEPIVDLEGLFVLKMYDWRYSVDESSSRKLGGWSLARDVQLGKRR